MMVTYHVRLGKSAYLVEATDAIDAISRASELHSLATGKSAHEIARLTFEAQPYQYIEPTE